VCVIIGVSMTAFLLLRLVGGAKFERIGLKFKMKGASRDYNQTPQMLVVLGAVNGSLVINPHFSGPSVRNLMQPKALSSRFFMFSFWSR
jgi:hypothetical protein